MDASPLPPTRPYWIPADLDIDTLPEGMQVAIAQILGPSYEELVVGARSELERLTGDTVLRLLWLELQEHFDLVQYVPGGSSGEATDRQAAINRLLRLIGAKQKATNFLLRIEELRLKPRDPLKGIWPLGKGG